MVLLRILGLHRLVLRKGSKLSKPSFPLSLFIRSSRGMMLTHEGQALLRYCNVAKDLEGEALAKISNSGKKSEVRVAITWPTSIMRSRVVPGCARVATEMPALILNFSIRDTNNRYEDLRSGVAQLAILSKEQVAREMDSKLLKPEQYMLVATTNWKNRTLEEILTEERIIDFEHGDQMTFSYLKKFKLHSYARSERHFVNNNESLVECFGVD